jgi:glycine oxidase
LGYFCRMDQLLIVGGGLAGTILALECKQRNIDFTWLVSDKIPAASFAAYGMCNPVHIRNQVPVWRASELYEVSKTFFRDGSANLNTDAFSILPICHLVTDEEELINWRKNAESTGLWKYCSGEPTQEIIPFLNHDFKSEIRIHESFYVNIPAFILAARSDLKKQISHEELMWKDLKPTSEEIQYKDSVYSQVIFADGMSGMKNPYFSYIPFNPCKGQVLHLHIKGLELKEAIHKKIVLVPLTGGTYLCGATYEWTDLSAEVTDEGKAELLDQLQYILGGKYVIEVIGQMAGVRPAISDRRPVVGSHPVHRHISILNGFGTRGLLVGPAAAKNLLDHLLAGAPIWAEWDLKRFDKRFRKKLE